VAGRPIPARRRAIERVLAVAAAWTVSPSVSAVTAPAALDGLTQPLTERWPDVHSVAVVHQGRAVFDFHRPPFVADSLHDVQSVTKSVLALLFGQAMADGHVRGPNELVALRLPALLRLGFDARVQRLRFAHLLTMTAGWPPDEAARRDRDDDLGQIVRRPFLAEPGARFAYDNGAANLLALALAQAVGEPLAAYARRRLFEPLGIGRFDWRVGAHGHALGALGLSLSTRAMARLGELVLRDGQWDGRALVPADYLRAATRAQSTGGLPLSAAYGYLWWIGQAARGRTASPAIMASGYGGQWIYIDRALDLVVAITSRRTPESAARGQGLALIHGHILPVVRRTA